MTKKVVGHLAPAIEAAEILRAKRKPTENLDAYDCYLRGLTCQYQRSRAGADEALRLFLKAAELDPEFAIGHGWVALSYCFRRQSGWMTDIEFKCAEGVRFARRAISLGPDDAIALSTGGFALAFLGRELDAGAGFVDRAAQPKPRNGLGGKRLG
jgi:hypothetical protein